MSFYTGRHRVDRTRTRAGVPDYAYLGTVLSAANIFRDKKLGVKAQLEESRLFKERLLENFQNVHQGVRERVMGASQEWHLGGTTPIIPRAAAVDKDGGDDPDPDPYVPESPPPHEIPSQSSGYQSQESPNSSPDPKGLKRLNF